MIGLYFEIFTVVKNKKNIVSDPRLQSSIASYYIIVRDRIWREYISKESCQPKKVMPFLKLCKVPRKWIFNVNGLKEVYGGV